ncbi:MAG: OmpH family outer membrane protein [Prevotellaceae bacterium]|jgi:outer membrane protein|nr:OmpH family outer membrane protein [Prevotellaceae bacterium]
MRKASFIVNAVLAVAVIVLYVLYFCGSGGKGYAPAIAGSSDSSSVIAAEGSIVYIQIDSLVNKYDMFHELRLEFEQKAKAADDDLTKRGRSFEREAKDFQEKVQKGLITRSQAEELQMKLQQKQQDLQQYAEKLRVDMSEEEAVMLRRIYDAVLTYLTEYNKSHNYSLILSTSGSTNAVMQGHPSLNITQDVLKGLNGSYVKPKK